MPVQTFRGGILPYIKRYKVRHPGSKRGIILVDLDFLRAYIAKFVEEPKAGPLKTNTSQDSKASTSTPAK
jgi:hypothetical protein